MKKKKKTKKSSPPPGAKNKKGSFTIGELTFGFELKFIVNFDPLNNGFSLFDDSVAYVTGFTFPGVDFRSMLIYTNITLSTQTRQRRLRVI